MEVSTKISNCPTLIKGKYSPPGDKSISHRSVMFGALASGKSRYTNFLQSEDCLHTLQAFQQMGVHIDLDASRGILEVDGVGLRGLVQPQSEIYLGNSGTSMRLILGILAGQKIEVVLSGDPSLSVRPMSRVTTPLKQMGAQIKGKDKGNFAPLTIRGGALKAIEYVNNLGSAQVKSALLFAGLYAEGKTRLQELFPSRNHSEFFLKASGAKITQKDEWLEIEPCEKLNPLEARIAGDMSSAAFFIVGAAMTEGSELVVEDVNLNPTRCGVIEVLKRMGANIRVDLKTDIPEPLGTVYVKGTKLKGSRITKTEIPSLIDELPILMVAMACAEGESIISGAEELRVKETDRIASMADNLSRAGAKIEELPDGCLIRGVSRLKGVNVKSYGDHRTVMSMVISKLLMDGDLEIDDTRSIATSYPSFFADYEKLAQS